MRRLHEVGIFNFKFDEEVKFYIIFSKAKRYYEKKEYTIYNSNIEEHLILKIINLLIGFTVLIFGYIFCLLILIIELLYNKEA